MSFQRSGEYNLIKFDVDAFRDALASATADTEQAVKRAIYSTMAKTRRHAMTLLSTIVREKWNIKKKDLDDRIRVWAGERGRGYESFEMIIKGKSVSLAHFGAVQVKGNVKSTTRKSTRMKRVRGQQGVSVEIIKGQRTQLSRSWFTVVPGFGVAIMRRKGDDRYPITVSAVISPASFLGDAEMADRFTDGIMAYLERTFEHELRWRLSQAGLQ